MSNRYHRLIERQTQVTVTERAYNRPVDLGWYGALAVIVAGVFYFIGLFTGPALWRVLTGG